MWEWLKNSDNLSALGSTLGGLGSIAGGFMQYKAGKDALDFQKNMYTTQYNDYMAQRKKNEEAMASVFGGGGLGSYSSSY